VARVRGPGSRTGNRAPAPRSRLTTPIAGTTEVATRNVAIFATGHAFCLPQLSPI
jgi:hypothetical protein